MTEYIDSARQLNVHGQKLLGVIILKRKKKKKREREENLGSKKTRLKSHLPAVLR